MKSRLIFYLVIIIIYQGNSQSFLNLSANYETIGATILLENSDPEKDAYAILEYKESTTDEWIQGFPLSRVNNDLNLCSGSIFWLLPNTAYDVKVQIFDSTTIALNGQTLQGIVTTLEEPKYKSINEVTHHVTPTGKGGFYTLQEAINIAQANDLIILDTGTYFVGNITFPNNGSETSPIYIKGIDRDKVILDGGYETSLVWTPYNSKGVYQTITSVGNPNLIIADGVRLYPHQTFPDLQDNKITLSYLPLREYPAEVGGFYRNPTLLPLLNFGDPVGITKNKLYIKLLDGSDPNIKNIEVSKQANCFNFQDNHHFNISHLTFKNYGVGHVATTIILSNSNNIIIDSCSFLANNTSIRLNTSTNNVLIQHCDFKDYFFNWSAWKIKGTQDSYAPFNARFPYNSRNLEKGSLMFGFDFYGNNIVFRKNRIRDYHQGGQIAPASSISSKLSTKRKSLDIDFYENTIINCGGDGFEIDGYARNVRVFNNRFEECHAPLSLAVAEEGPLYILRNVFSNIIPDSYDNGNELSAAKGHPLKFQVGGGKVNGDIYFYHNTIDAQNDAFGMNVYQVTTADAWKKMESKNNIFQTDKGIALNVRTISGIPNFISDYNNYYSNNTDVFCVNLNNANRDCHSSLFDLTATYGWDKHSLQIDPLFVDGVNGDYKLRNSSPLINSGSVIQGINELNYHGTHPDMGAIENNESVSISNEQNSIIKIYPNPTSQFVIVELMNVDYDSSYSIYDIQGQLVSSAHFVKESTVVDLRNLSDGVYVIRVKNLNNILSAKIVIDRE